MKGGKSTVANCVQYELEIEIAATPDKVWKALIEETSAWWLPDFHMVAPDSTVEFDVRPGGQGLFEVKPDGQFLQWYAVQSYVPAQRLIYLIGHIAADYGGPATSSLRLSVEQRGGTSVLSIADGLVGNVSEETARSLHSGWQELFGAGLRSYIQS